jgi:hypothetical protein
MCWKAKRKSKRRKNNKKMHECEEFKQMREIWINKTEQYKREFEEFIEQDRKDRIEMWQRSTGVSKEELEDIIK